MRCLICGDERAKPLSSSSPFCKCRRCRSVSNSSHKLLEYNDSYFIEDYRAQYGKTYEEDFPGIYASSLKRIERFRKLWKRDNPESVLDVGAALGFFLKAAADSGFKRAEGVEISEYASKYAEEKFGFTMHKSSFEDAGLNGEYDLVTAWYFVEHSKDPLMTIKSLASLVSDRGGIAFSLPSYFGPMFYFSRDQWEKSHPVDHSVDFSPVGIKRVLKILGFRKVKVYPSGFHPERVVKKGSILYPVFSPLYSIFSKLFAFSDTIEVYACR